MRSLQFGSQLTSAVASLTRGAIMTGGYQRDEFGYTEEGMKDGKVQTITNECSEDLRKKLCT